MIQKHVFLGMNQDTSPKDLRPEEYRSALNLVAVSEGVGASTRLENMRGMRETAMPVDSSSICVGMWNYREKNKIYAFYSGAIDSIIEYDGVTDVGTLLMQNNLLGLSIDYPVIDVFIVENLLYFNDAYHGMRKINIDYAKTGALNTINDERAISLIKPPPLTLVTSNRSTDPVLTLINPRIRITPLQFATRYVYGDDEVSVISPISKISPALDYDFETNAYNRVDVVLSIDNVLSPIIDRVELLVREKNDGFWFVYEKFDPGEFTISNPDNTKSVQYSLYLDRSGAVLSEEETGSSAESVPRVSSSMALMEDRAFAVSSVEEYDTEQDNWDCSINIATDPLAASFGINQDIYKPIYYKENSFYTWGLVFFDQFGRKTAPVVRANMTKQIPNNLSAYQVNKTLLAGTENSWVMYNHPDAYLANPLLSGKPPSWAVKYQFARSENQSYQTWFKAKFLVMPLHSTQPHDDEPDPLLTEIYLDNGYWYQSMYKILKEHLANGREVYLADYVDLVIPDGFPLPIDKNSLVRLAFKLPTRTEFIGTDVAKKEIYNIIQIENGRIRIKGLNWVDMVQLYTVDHSPVTGIGFATATNEIPYDNEFYLHFEILNPIVRVANPLLYETGKIYDIVNPGTASRSFAAIHESIDGDSYYAANQDHERAFVNNPDGSTHAVPKITTNRDNRYLFTVSWASLSPIIDRQRAGDFTGQGYDVDSNGIYIRRLGRTTYEQLANIDNPVTIEKDLTVLSLESGLFTRTAYNSRGRVTVEVPNQKELHRGSQVRYSRTFIQDSLINGLSNFPEENKYAISSDRGDITKLIASNERVLVAVHTRSITSLYINQRFINSGEGEAFLAQTDKVIGDSRKLLLNYGTKHPESVIAHDSRIYGFDSIMSEPWRRSQDGITPLALTYGMKTYFETKGEQIRTVQTLDPAATITVLGGYDQWLDMYVLTFSQIEYIDGTGSPVTIPAETIGFSERVKRWVSFYSFKPEYYSSIMNNLVSAKDQSLWRHMDTVDRNLFYGVYYPSSITIDANESNDKPKRYMNIGISSNKKWTLTCKTPDGKESLLNLTHFIQRDNIFYADFLRNKNTPTANLLPGRIPLLHGEKLIGETMEITLTNNDSEQVRLDAIYVGYSPMTGHLLSQS